MLRQESQQCAKQQKNNVVAGRDTKRPLRALGFERPPQVQQILDLPDSVVHGFREIGRERGQLEVSAHAHEKLVLKCVPQPREDTADGRLAQKQALACTRDVALGEQHVERDEQVQIELAKVHGAPGSDFASGNRRQLCRFAGEQCQPPGRLLLEARSGIEPLYTALQAAA